MPPIGKPKLRSNQPISQSEAAVPKHESTDGAAKPAAIPAKRGALDLNAVLRSSDESELEGDIIIHGPPKHGKTFLAASASEFFPDDMEELGTGKTFDLEDMLWISFDAGATAGFRGAGLKVREINFRKIREAKPLPEALDTLMLFVKQAVRENPVQYIVADTVSMLDRMLVEHYGTVHADNPNTFAMWKDVLMRHMRFRGGLAALSGEKIYLCHSKAQLEASLKTEDQKHRAEAGRLPGGEPIMPDLSGQSKTAYIGNSSLELYIKCSVAPGKDKKKVTRKVFPFGGNGFEGSNRFHHILELEEEAHLRHIFDKIRGAR